MKGQFDHKLNSLFKNGLVVAGVATLGVIGFGVVGVIGAPLAVTVIANAAFAGGFAYLSGITYGIVNDLIGTKTNLPYFMLGHQPRQRSAIRSNSPFIVGTAWGYLATFPLALIAAMVFAVTFGIMGTIGLPFVGFALPIIPLAIAGVLAYAEKVARHTKQFGNPAYWWGMGSNNYQVYSMNEFYQNKSSTELEAIENQYNANSDRNIVGFKFMPMLAVAALVVLVALSITAAFFFPPILALPAISLYAPLAVAGVMSTFCLSTGIYSYINQDKQVDNEFKMEWPELETQTAETTESHGKMMQQGLAESPQALPKPKSTNDKSNVETLPEGTTLSAQSMLVQQQPVPSSVPVYAPEQANTL